MKGQDFGGYIQTVIEYKWWIDNYFKEIVRKHLKNLLSAFDTEGAKK